MIMKTNPILTKFIFVLTLSLFLACTKTEPEEYLADLGDTYITVNEFKAAFEFNPYLEMLPSVKEAKKRLLSTMVAEKLMAQTLKSAPEDVNQLISQHNREALIEAFWQEEILKKITISPKELQDAYNKSKRKIIVQYLVFSSPEQALRQKKRLDEGYDFIQLAELNGFARQNIPTDTLSFDGSLPNIQQVAFHLKEGQVSTLIKEGNRYFILRKTGEQDELFRSEQDFKAAIPKLKKVLRTIKSQQAFTVYFQTHLKNKGYHLSKDAFKRMLHLVEEQIFGSDTDESGRTRLFSEYLTEQNKKREDMDFPVVTFHSKQNWTAKTLLQRIGVAPYPVSFETRGVFRNSMLLAAKHVLDDEIIVQQAKKASLQKTAYVKEQNRLWADHLRALACMRDILRTKKNKEKDINEMEVWLLQEIKEHPVKINKKILDTLKVVPTGVLPLKQHFPGRTAIPLFKPFPQMSQWEAALFK